MTLTQLKIFIMVAELGNVTKAAERLGLTQSAASAAISAIENTYQVKLFERVGRSIELSETGKRFLPEAGVGGSFQLEQTAFIRMQKLKKSRPTKLLIVSRKGLKLQ